MAYAPVVVHQREEIGRALIEERGCRRVVGRRVGRHRATIPVRSPVLAVGSGSAGLAARRRQTRHRCTRP